jgi:hypothetical protein
MDVFKKCKKCKKYEDPPSICEIKHVCTPCKVELT